MRSLNQQCAESCKNFKQYYEIIKSKWEHLDDKEINLIYIKETIKDYGEQLSFIIQAQYAEIGKHDSYTQDDVDYIQKHTRLINPTFLIYLLLLINLKKDSTQILAEHINPYIPLL